jgi:ribosome-associated protein
MPHEINSIVSSRDRRPIIREQGNAAHVLDPERTAPQTDIPPWLIAVRAAESKKAQDIRVLDVRDVTSFADYFVICTGANARQIQAITEEIGLQLKKSGEYPMSVEGFDAAEWVLADYGNYLIHVFSAKAREYYDLERLWRHGKNVEIPPV